MLRSLAVAACLTLLQFPLPAVSSETRARDLGVPFEGLPGAHNAITDVTGVEVGQVTLISGNGKLIRGRSPVRTGVTAILPRGRQSTMPVYGGWFALNGAGEMTGTTWLEEGGLIHGPVMITNTHSVGVVHDATIAWLIEHGWKSAWFTPVVAETYDGRLNDINGFHVTAAHAREALDGARPGVVTEGSVGGGTGMICADFKGGIGTSSRIVETARGTYSLGVLVQCNYGIRKDLRIAGVPVGAKLARRYLPCYGTPADAPAGALLCGDDAAADPRGQAEPSHRDGSIIVVVATDAPLLPHQLKRLAKRPALALGRMGSVVHEGSGDIFVSFSTAPYDEASGTTSIYPDAALNLLFAAAVQATEESIVNALVAARDMTGANGLRVYALPHSELARLLPKQP